MNKKLLFGIMSLAALAACTNDDFETQNGAQVSEQVSPIQFEVINNAEVTRAKMEGNSIAWSAAAGDLFTLYHGGTLTETALGSYQNATYKASEGEGGAVLTTPSVINPGPAVMVWPADTAFNSANAEAFLAAASTAGFYTHAGKLAVKIPEVLTNVENNIPYVSDLLTIDPYAAYSEKAANANTVPTAYRTAGKDRKYAVYMRPMASQLILKADYAGTDAVINALATGSDPIAPIALTSVDIESGTTPLTKAIDLKFTEPTEENATTGTHAQGLNANWKTVANNVWSKVTGFDLESEGSVVGATKLSTKCINGIESAKFLILPQKPITGHSLTGASIVVNTIYGSVEISAAGGYEEDDLKGAWYRYAASGDATYGETAGTGSDAGKVTTTIQQGLAQVIDKFSTNTTTKATSVVVNEPTGAVGTRYVKVLLTKLNMDGLHVKTDKQLYDAVRVWKEIGAASTNVTVNLDGDAKTGEFEISQKTIAKINEINAALAEDGRSFFVKPCKDNGEKCNTIVITGGGEIPADLTFIKKNAVADNFAAVALNKGESWKWAASTVKSKKAFKVAINTERGISKIINRGTLVSDATATIAIFTNAATPGQVTNIPFENNGTWNITAGELNVQVNVINNGTVKISKDAEYRQDYSIFKNEAETVPERYFMNDPSKSAEEKEAFVEKIGKVENKGVFATVNSGKINNYGLIEHADVDAKTYITANQSLATDGFTADASFAKAFDKATSGAGNKLGRINLPYSNRKETHLSISNNTANGLVSVTVSTEAGSAPKEGKLDLTDLGDYVNFCIINSGVTEVTKASDKVEYLEFNAGSTEIEINTDFKHVAKDEASKTPEINDNLTGLIVLSPITIIRDKTVEAGATYLGAKLYKAGAFDCDNFNAYFGNTKDNKSTKIITWGK